VRIFGVSKKEINFEVHQRSWGVFLGSKGVQEKSKGFYWGFLVFKVHYEGLKFCDATKCTILRLWCCSLGSYYESDSMRLVRAWRLHVTRIWRFVYGMKHAGEVIRTLCMNILYWHLYKSYWVDAQLRRLVSPIGWYLHNILLSWYSAKYIGVSNRLVPRSFETVGWFLQKFIKISFCDFRPRGFPS
jgi:hypothetical protein